MAVLPMEELLRLRAGEDKMAVDIIDYEQARTALLTRVCPMPAERIPLDACAGRVLAQALVAAEDVPPFDRSPYDGYALRSADTAGIDTDHPVTLRILEEVPAGHVARCAVTQGTAVKVLTGSPLPSGADAIVPFEETHFTEQTVTLFKSVRPGGNVIRAGEDVKAGSLLAAVGTPIDSGLAATLAGQGVATPTVFRKPKVGIVSTGSELVEPGHPLKPGMIYNTSRYALAAALARDGVEPAFIGSAGDDVDAIAALIMDGLGRCDALVLTGGVSVGDYDLTPAAMEKCGAQILFRGVALKPGMACCYGMVGDKPLMALSGNPASAMTNYYAVAQPAVKKLAGLSDHLPREIEVTLCEGFGKRSPYARLLRGKLEIVSGRALLRLPGDQGNVVISSMIGCDAMAVVPAGAGPVAPGTMLKGFLL